VVDVRIQPREPQVLRFAALGDIGTGDANQARVAGTLRRLCAQGQCDLVLLLGDNFYERGVSSIRDAKFARIFEQVYGGIAQPFLPVLGNHDVKQDALAQVLYSLVNPAWRMPNFSYQFELPWVRFFAVNSTVSLLAWMALRRKLQADPQRWTIVYGHHPLYGTGTQGDMDWPSRAYWHRHLQRHVDVYLSGHDHQLELLGIPGQHTRYVISGAGGSHYRDHPREPSPWRHTHAQSAFVHRDNGLAWFEVTPQQITLRFLDAEGGLLHQSRWSKGDAAP